MSVPQLSFRYVAGALKTLPVRALMPPLVIAGAGASVAGAATATLPEKILALPARIPVG